MPPKLDRCVKHLMEKGHTKEEAWAICKARLKQANAQFELEKNKAILTGQLMTKETLSSLKQEIETKFMLKLEEEGEEEDANRED